jgi:hypothetical protein
LRAALSTVAQDGRFASLQAFVFQHEAHEGSFSNTKRTKEAKSTSPFAIFALFVLKGSVCHCSLALRAARIGAAEAQSPAK